MLGGVSESKLIPGLTHGPEPYSLTAGKQAIKLSKLLERKGLTSPSRKGASVTKTLSEDGSMAPKSMRLWIAWCPYVFTFGLLILFIVALGLYSYARELPGLELVLFSLATLHAWFFYRGEFDGPHSISQPALLTFICIAMCVGDMVGGELLGFIGFGVLSMIWSAFTWRRVRGASPMKREIRAKLDRVVESVTQAVKARNETNR